LIDTPARAMVWIHTFCVSPAETERLNGDAKIVTPSACAVETLAGTMADAMRANSNARMSAGEKTRLMVIRGSPLTSRHQARFATAPSSGDGTPRL